jgi:formamidopyrimidine-DNA glycosylase
MIDLSTGYSLLIHLKMTGQLVFVGDTRFGAGHPNDSLVNELPDKSTRVTLTFTDDSKLFFNDQRKFGWMRLMPTVEIPNIDFMQKVGPEPLDDDFTPKEFMQRFARRSKTNIKAALLDQSIVAGVGNIYADESLWGAKLHPKRLVGSVTEQEFTTLFHELREVMSLAVEKGGSSNHTYVNAEGKKGSYMDFARVFRREGLPCPRCGTTIEKLRVAGRGTHICPHCQQL